VEISETIYSLLAIATAMLIFLYWLAQVEWHSPSNDAFLRDLCFIWLSPPGTSLTELYDLDICIGRGMVSAKTPIYPYCFSRVNATAVAVNITFADSTLADTCLRGRAVLRITRESGRIVVQRGG
jgi:hypothetical protein